MVVQVRLKGSSGQPDISSNLNIDYALASDVPSVGSWVKIVVVTNAVARIVNIDDIKGRRSGITVVLVAAVISNRSISIGDAAFVSDGIMVAVTVDSEHGTGSSSGATGVVDIFSCCAGVGAAVVVVGAGVSVASCVAAAAASVDAIVAVDFNGWSAAFTVVVAGVSDA